MPFLLPNQQHQTLKAKALKAKLIITQMAQFQFDKACM